MREEIKVEQKYIDWLEAASMIFGDSFESGKIDILTF